MGTHYDTLEVSPKASAEVIRAAYRSLMQRHHPDRHGGDPEQVAQAARITQAYEVLSNEKLKSEYDRGLWSDLSKDASVGKTQTAAGEQASRAARRAAQPVRASAHPAAVAQGHWGARGWLTLVVVVCLGVLVWRLWSGGVLPGRAPSWQQLRQAFDNPQATEAQRRALYASKLALLDREASWRETDQRERLAEWQARSVELLAAPLVVTVRNEGLMADGTAAPIDVGELRLARVVVLVGSFDAARALGLLERHRERLRHAVQARLSALPASALSRGEAAPFVQQQVLGALAQALETNPDQEFPSTWHESPGRYGPVQVVLPEGFEFRPLAAAGAAGGAVAAGGVAVGPVGGASSSASSGAP